MTMYWNSIQWFDPSFLICRVDLPKSQISIIGTSCQHIAQPQCITTHDTSCHTTRTTMITMCRNNSISHGPLLLLLPKGQPSIIVTSHKPPILNSRDTLGTTHISTGPKHQVTILLNLPNANCSIPGYTDRSVFIRTSHSSNRRLMSIQCFHIRHGIQIISSNASIFASRVQIQSSRTKCQCRDSLFVTLQCRNWRRGVRGLSQCSYIKYSNAVITSPHGHVAIIIARRY
mmetsp:Transcript_6412/g.14477  ORF Transcript_6412/g.14477 Transcript_6412/m.14477 type:complete len:230 (+) Transcript_6412:329-1018(+)